VVRDNDCVDTRIGGGTGRMPLSHAVDRQRHQSRSEVTVLLTPEIIRP
jgi:hypothetical protein